MAELSFYIGVIGNVISVLVFLSPVETFWRIVRQKSTEEFKSLPYICTLMGSSLWTYYGIVTPGEYLVATVNGFGALVEAIYVALFLLYVPRNQKMYTALAVGTLNVLIPVAAILATRFAFEEEKTRSHAMGFICAGLNIIMYGSPLSALKTVVTTKSVKYMPFWLSFFLFFNGGIWALYAFLLHDVFVLVPNGIGCMLGALQLIVYGIYKDTKPFKKRILSVIFEAEEADPESPLPPRQPLLS